MWNLLLSLLGGPVVRGLLDAYRARLDAAATAGALAVELAKKELEAEIAARAEASKVIIAEQGRWYTAVVRPLFALPFIVFAWKVVVWDKVLGLGVTDALDPNMWSVFIAVVTAYFGGRSLEKIARIFARR
jgi:hypothetical protein